MILWLATVMEQSNGTINLTKLLMVTSKNHNLPIYVLTIKLNKNGVCLGQIAIQSNYLTMKQ